MSTAGAGASVRREYERRSAKREARIREAHPRLGGLILAISEEPRSTTAWARGARGEEILGRNLDGLEPRGVRVLHDRRIPRTRANIDHIAVAPTGVHVIDAKRYKGRPALRVEGGIIRPRVHKLMLGARDCTRLVDGMHKQLDVVQEVLDQAGLEEVPVQGALCFVDADWPLIGGSFVLRDVAVLWPKKLSERLTAPGEMSPGRIATVHEALARALPAA
ncbi:MAG: nuclease-related domain-containing protein [Cellulomonas sp.]